MVKKVAVFESYYEAAKDLPPEEFKQFFSAIFEKAFDGTEPVLEGTVKIMYQLVKPTLEKSLELSEARAAAGRKGGAPEGNSNASKQANSSKNKQIQANDKQKQADKDKEEDKDKEKDIKEKQEKEKVASAPRFVKPTVAQVSEYCRERGNGINPESFVDFYESKGWKVGSQPMKDWKACVRTWENRHKGEARAAPKKTGFGNIMEHNYTSEDFTDLERQLLEN